MWRFIWNDIYFGAIPILFLSIIQLDDEGPEKFGAYHMLKSAGINDDDSVILGSIHSALMASNGGD